MGYIALGVSVALAIGIFAVLAVRRPKKIRRSDPNNATQKVAASRRHGFVAFVALLAIGLIAFWALPNDVSGQDSDDKPKELTIDLDKFDACPNGVAVAEPTFYVRGTNILSPQSVTPQLPANDPDKLIRALFGEDGYACKDPLVAVAMSMVQPGLLPFTERDDANEIQDWIVLFASNGEAWQSYVEQAAKRFDGILWDSEWLPEDGDATFLIADAAQDQALPKLLQREEGLPQPWGAYRFKGAYGDSAMLKELALIADYGWLALPEGLFSNTPVIEVQDQMPPLLPQEPPPPLNERKGGGNDQSGGGSGKAKGKGGGNNSDKHNGDTNGCTGNCGEGSTEAGNGSGTGEGGGTDCKSNCPGTGGGGNGCGSCGTTTTSKPKPPTTTSPPPTSPPTTRPPTTTSPPPTSPPTTRPPTTTSPPTTAPPPTAPPTTKKPDPGCDVPGFC